MEFVLIIIVVVIVSIISAAVKKKPKSSDQQDAPVPARPTMSDIQRAFMMAAGMPDKAEATSSQPAPQPRPQPTVPPHKQTLSAAFMPPIKAAVMESSMGGNSYEGMGPSDIELLNPYEGVQISKYFMDAENTEQELSNPHAVRPQPHAAVHISLFESQQDIVKAIIYSEILPRRGRAPRFR